MTDKQTKRPSHIIWQVFDRKTPEGKDRWNRVGAAWEHKGDGMGLNFFAYPIGGRIVMRPNKQGLVEDGLPGED